MSNKPVALTIAGSDSGGGAGIQADLKSMEANGVFGTSVITAITAQNTTAVTDAQPVALDLISAQLEAVLSDFPVAAIKTGMLATADIIERVANELEQRDGYPLVVDPVMISKSGYELLDPDAVATLRNRLLPLATVITPNLHEAGHLLNTTVRTEADMRQAARSLFKMGPNAVLVKGGHLAATDDALDVLYDGSTFHAVRAPRIDTPHTHGTGCTYASAIAAHLAHQRTLPVAVRHAKSYVTNAIAHALPLGSGHGPTNHFFHLTPFTESASLGVDSDVA
ncbi:MAG: bifunctional hydroxymethylpyrimidine kinase/phosphomethylpyrimidine kinase [Longimonas sp.]|uniref:bifunctional hydroxymethylpyrimidine kinase/phosphomethylpyrimidine kinase n=1 Tax=Longimonas sp. TaxID=2039626 RepID=UPI003974E73C